MGTNSKTYLSSAFHLPFSWVWTAKIPYLSSGRSTHSHCLVWLARLQMEKNRKIKAREWQGSLVWVLMSLRRLHRVFGRARSGYEHNASFESVNMQNKHGGSIRSYDSHLKRYVKNSLTQPSFYVMESRVFSNCTRNIHRPSTPEKEVNWKENTAGKIAKRWQIATDWKVYTCSDIDLGEVLFHYLMFCDLSFGEIS